MNPEANPVRFPDRVYATLGNPRFATYIHAFIAATGILLSIHALPVFGELFSGGSHFPRSFYHACSFSDFCRAYRFWIGVGLGLLLYLDYWNMTRLHRDFGPLAARKWSSRIALGLIALLIYSWLGVALVLWKIVRIRDDLGW